MGKRFTIAAVVLGLVLPTASVAIASEGVEKAAIVHFFDDSGEPIGPDVVGKATLIRRDDALKATAQVTGLKPGGVYTFWWVVGDFAAFPDVFVALGNSKVVAANGKATVRMTAYAGQPSISGFIDETTAPFRDTLDFDLQTAEVHVEVAYHGQIDDPDYTSQWQADFWTGADGLCPITGSTQAETQPHCPVSHAAIFLGS